MSLGKMIRRHRGEMGLSQARLAASAGLSQGYLSQIENEEVCNPSASALLRLAQAMHLDAHYLLEAAGYPEVAHRNGGDGLETTVDPDLLVFLVRLSPEGQRYLLRLLEGMEGTALALLADSGRRRQGQGVH
jgi:transcriptional regulator with XRE-family HTH domain